MIQPPPLFPPQLNFFGSTITEEGRDIFAGHVHAQTDEAGFPGRRIGIAELSTPKLPVIEKKKRGRPSNTHEYVTLLAHCEMVKKLAPEGTSVTEIRRSALQAMHASKQIKPYEWACDQVALGEGRKLQIQLTKAIAAINGMRKCLVMSKSDQTGFWLAIENPPVERNGVQVIDSIGWLCFAGQTAERGRIKWECSGYWGKK
ncbi:MAG: hypothetical protein KAX47_01610 [Zoogloea sp.]|nr:hypothetical protein [Zoogloea sp.]